jgi:hypothetical protein
MNLVQFTSREALLCDVSLPTSEEMVKTERGQFHQKQNLASVQAENDGIGVWIELFLSRQLAHMLIFRLFATAHFNL